MLEHRQQWLFNPGPVNLDPAIKDNLFNIELCHRQPEFLDLVQSVRRRLAELLGFPHERYRLGLLHGSGTLAVDAALATFVRGRVLVVDNGLYCTRIAQTLRTLGVHDLHAVEFGIGQRIDLTRVAEAAHHFRPEWIAVVHHETTTGILNPIGDVAGIAEGTSARLFVDAVSSVGAHPLGGVGDVVCFNSSKCLEGMPGIAAVFWRSDLQHHPTIPALDVSQYSDGMASTPNVQAFIALDIALDLLAGEDRVARYRRLARHVWSRGAEQFELFLPEEDRSNVLTSFRLGNHTIDELYARAARRSMVIYPGQAHLHGEIFRVANMGAAIDERVIDQLFDALG